jgi:hypothetical protein
MIIICGELLEIYNSSNVVPTTFFSIFFFCLNKLKRKLISVLPKLRPIPNENLQIPDFRKVKLKIPIFMKKNKNPCLGV